MINDILKIIEDTFDECVTVNAFETITGIENEIEGRDEFMAFLKERITKKIISNKFPYSTRILNDVLSTEKRALASWEERLKSAYVLPQHIDNGKHRIGELTNAINCLKYYRNDVTVLRTYKDDNSSLIDGLYFDNKKALEIAKENEKKGITTSTIIMNIK